MAIFVNRIDELSKLGQSTAGLIVIFGRRRVGKTTLVERWGKTCNLHYSQAIEGGGFGRLKLCVHYFLVVLNGHFRKPINPTK